MSGMGLKKHESMYVEPDEINSIAVKIYEAIKGGYDAPTLVALVGVAVGISEDITGDKKEAAVMIQEILDYARDEEATGRVETVEEVSIPVAQRRVN